MAITVTWSIVDMKRDVASGGVKLVYWQCVAADDTNTECSAVESGKLQLEPDADADGFVAYDDLTEATVLGWVKDYLGEDAVSAMETQRTEKVAAQVARKTSEANGTPWQPAADPDADGNE